ncbi:MAG: hypothetical protein ACE5OS_10255 [Anaerolineae bacterium]
MSKSAIPLRAHNTPTRIRVERAFILGLLLLALGARLIPGPRVIDDAYVTFRYARNLVVGNGFVYNPGERVLGTTTPLYTLLLAGLALVTGCRDFTALALAVNALAGAASVGLLYSLGKRVTGHPAPAAAAALLWAISPYTVTFAVGGMETDLTIALLLAAAYAHVSNRARAMAVFSALALLTRPDTAILLGLLWLDLTLTRQRVPWREGLITLALLAPWLVFGTLYFGSPITSSIAAKSVTYRLPPEAGFVGFLQHYATPFFEHRVLPSLGVFAVFVLYLTLCARGGLDLYRRERRTWPLIAYPFAYATVFAVANPLLFRWYLSPPLPFYFLLILTGVWALGRDLRKLTVRNPQPAICALFTAAALTLTLNAWTPHPDHGPDRPAPEMAWFKLELLYSQAADVVLTRATPDDTLCAGDIGMLGYRTGLHMLDTVGLVTPEVAQYYPADSDIYVIGYAIPADLVLTLDPDFIVIPEVYGRKGLLPDSRFQAQYRLLEKIETDIYGSDGMLVFQRTPHSKEE